MANYRQCSNCVMDTSDPDISFNEAGVCNHCTDHKSKTEGLWFPNEEGKKRLEILAARIQEEEKSKPYDCILGLSGGVDSSYLALKMHEWKFRPLVVHVDGGWNTELAVQNIENIVKYCGWHLHTHVINWKEMRDLQLAYLKSGIANQDVPQDHAFFASLYHFAVKNNIRYVVSGGNIATEVVFPESWHWSAMDSISLKAIHKKFGTRKLKQYKTISFWQMYFYYPLIRNMKVIRPLNLMPYDKKEALLELKQKVNYKDYERKHGESVFTKFFQNHWLPQKFGFDKRRIHFSSMILSGQMSREEAMLQLEKPLYDEKELAEDKMYIAKKLGLSMTEFEAVLAAPIHSYQDFPSMEFQYRSMKKMQKILVTVFRKKIKNYS